MIVTAGKVMNPLQQVYLVLIQQQYCSLRHDIMVLLRTI